MSSQLLSGKIAGSISEALIVTQIMWSGLTFSGCEAKNQAFTHIRVFTVIIFKILWISWKHIMNHRSPAELHYSSERTFETLRRYLAKHNHPMVQMGHF